MKNKKKILGKGMFMLSNTLIIVLFISVNVLSFHACNKIINSGETDFLEKEFYFPLATITDEGNFVNQIIKEPEMPEVPEMPTFDPIDIPEMPEIPEFEMPEMPNYEAMIAQQMYEEQLHGDYTGYYPEDPIYQDYSQNYYPEPSYPQYDNSYVIIPAGAMGPVL